MINVRTHSRVLVFSNISESIIATGDHAVSNGNTVRHFVPFLATDLRSVCVHGHDFVEGFSTRRKWSPDSFQATGSFRALSNISSYLCEIPKSCHSLLVVSRKWRTRELRHLTASKTNVNRGWANHAKHLPITTIPIRTRISQRDHPND